MWPIGLKPPTSGADLSMLSGLGDTAVDFDIAPRRMAAADAEVNNATLDESIRSINVSFSSN